MFQSFLMCQASNKGKKHEMIKVLSKKDEKMKMDEDRFKHINNNFH